MFFFQKKSAQNESGTYVGKERLVDTREGKKLHDEVGFIKLRAQATAVGLLQLSIELRRVGVLDDAAIERVKKAIVDDLMLTTPTHTTREQHRASIQQRLSKLFTGGETLSESDPRSR